MEPVEEFPLSRGRFYIDLAWCYTKSGPPVVTFEIETTKKRLLRNLAKITMTDAKKTTAKPWFHVTILLKGHLTDGDMELVRGTSYTNNVEIIEDLLSSPKSARKLEEVLLNIRDSVIKEKSTLEPEASFKNRFTQLLEQCHDLSAESYILGNDAVDDLIGEFKNAI